MNPIASPDPESFSDLFALVYDELRRMAAGKMQAESPWHTLRPTELVNEAYLRLHKAADGNEKLLERPYFFRAAATAMQRILYEHARRKLADKRPKSADRTALSVDQVATSLTPEFVVDVHEALERLADVHPDCADVVRLRFFVGLTMKEISETLGIASRTLDDRWAFAKAWIGRQLKHGEDANESPRQASSATDE